MQPNVAPGNKLQIIRKAVTTDNEVAPDARRSGRFAPVLWLTRMKARFANGPGVRPVYASFQEHAAHNERLPSGPLASTVTFPVIVKSLLAGFPRHSGQHGPPTKGCCLCYPRLPLTFVPVVPDNALPGSTSKVTQTCRPGWEGLRLLSSRWRVESGVQVVTLPAGSRDSRWMVCSGRSHCRYEVICHRQ